MSAKVLAKIDPEHPWGESLSLEALAATRPPVVCDYCREPIVHDGEQWWHVRTGLSAHWRHKDCQPLCRDCGKPAMRAIGAEQFVGSGIRFVIDHFTCLDCASRAVGLVEHVR